MALYPLPPSSNESVMDNGRNVWQTGVYIILVLSHDLPKQCRLSHAGTPPWSFSVHCKMNKETISLRTVEEYNTISTCFLFLHAKKRAAGVDLHSQTRASTRVPVIAYLAPSTWPSKANQCLRWIDCSRIYAPPAFFAWTCSRSHNDL